MGRFLSRASSLVSPARRACTDWRTYADQNGVSRGIGFVRFETPDNAARAIELLNGRSLGGGEVLIVKVCSRF